MYLKSFVAGWDDMDFDGRFRNTAGLERATDVRLMFFAEHGYTVDVFRRQRVTSVLLKEKLDYQRNIELLEEYKLSLMLAGLSPDGSHCMLRSELLRADGKLAVRVTSTCGWLDLNVRKLALPPLPLVDALKALPMAADYQVLPGCVKPLHP